LAEQFPKEQVLYFPEEAIFSINRLQVEAEQVASRLAKRPSIIEILNDVYDLRDPWMLEHMPTGKPVSSGFLKLLNIFYGVVNHPNDEVVVFVEKIEGKLHYALRRLLIRDLSTMSKIKELYFTTQEKDIVKFVKKDLEVD
jgi:hypothetical protein